MKICRALLCFLILTLVVVVLPVTSHAVTVTGVVKDGSTDSVISGVDVYIYDSASMTTTYCSPCVTDANGAYETDTVPDGTLSVYIVFEATGYVNTFGTFAIQGQLDPVYLAPDGAAGSGTINGRITDAQTTDDYIPEVSLTLYSGINQTSGTSVATTTSVAADTGGTDDLFEFTGIDPGTYTILAEKNGFSNASINVVAIDGTPTTYAILMSRQLGTGELRIVLTWGTSPSDLDSHLYTPTIEDSSYHVYYGSPGSETTPPYAALDVDNTECCGPETITIKQLMPGTYTYAVEWYADSTGNNTPLGESGATVRVYDDYGLYATYNVPSSAGNDPPQNGDEWVVFSMDETGLIGGGSAANIIRIEDNDDCFINTINKDSSSPLSETMLDTLWNRLLLFFKD